MAKMVRLIGEVDDRAKQGFLAGAAALLFPIDWPEPFGLVMIEAMACGTPVIAFKSGSVPEVVDHGVTGFVVDGEEEAIQAIGRLARARSSHGSSSIRQTLYSQAHGKGICPTLRIHRRSHDPQRCSERSKERLPHPTHRERVDRARTPSARVTPVGAGGVRAKGRRANIPISAANAVRRTTAASNWTLV